MTDFAVIVTLALLISSAAIVLVLGLLAKHAISLREWIGAVLRFVAKTIIAIGLLGLCLFLTRSLEYGLIAWLMVMTVWVRAAIHWRAVQKRSLFAALAMAVDKQMPLGPLAMAFSAERHGGFGKRARVLADRLNKGVSLVDAIETSRGALPPEAAMAARVAAESGDLSGALEATSFAGRFDRTLLQTVMSRLFYILPGVLLFITFMQIKIAPSYAKIFDDFGMPLPPITLAVIRPSATASVGVLCFLLIVAMCLISVWTWCEWRGWIGPTLPGFKRIIKWVEMGVVLRVLALGAKRNCPLPRMLETLADSHPKRWVRHRLRAVVTDIKEGCSWQKSLQIEHMISSADVAVLVAAQRCGNLSWALGDMADSFQRKANYRLQALGQVVLPLLMVPLGILVCVLAIAYFAPLTNLIQALSV